MNTPEIVALAGVLAISAVAGELVITSFQKDGTVTWTNSFSNAVYRLQWSNSATGSWRDFEALANLDSIHATSSVVSATVPMFYRVAAQQRDSLDSCQGIYQYEAFDVDGKPLIVGWFSVGPGHDANVPSALVGTWALGYVGDPTCTDPRRTLGAQIGKGELVATCDPDGKLWINLTPKVLNYAITLYGNLQNGTFNGTWRWLLFGASQTNGTFSAFKIADGY